MIDDSVSTLSELAQTQSNPEANYFVLTIGFMIFVSIAVVLLINWILSNVKSQNKETVSKIDDLKESISETNKTFLYVMGIKPILEKVVSLYPTIEKFQEFMRGGNLNFDTFLNAQLDDVLFHFKNNFKNGSSVEKAEKKICEFNKKLMNELNTNGNSMDSSMKPKIAVLIDTHRKLLSRMLTELKNMNDSLGKPLMIEMWIDRLRILSDYFFVKIYSTDLLEKNDSELKEHLINYFNELDNSDKEDKSNNLNRDFGVKF